jgi:hypothetical protein
VNEEANMRRTNKQTNMKKLVIDTETIRFLESDALTKVAGGLRTFTCHPARNDIPGCSCP